jgi:glutamate--cysteine ligase
VSNPSQGASAPIQSKQDLIDFLAGGEKPAADWRIGTEHEKFVFRLDDLRPLPYDGPRGIRALLEGLTRVRLEPVWKRQADRLLQGRLASVTLEPGGQFELSGAPLETIHQTCNECTRTCAR